MSSYRKTTFTLIVLISIEYWKGFIVVGKSEHELLVDFNRILKGWDNYAYDGGTKDLGSRVDFNRILKEGGRGEGNKRPVRSLRLISIEYWKSSVHTPGHGPPVKIVFELISIEYWKIGITLALEEAITNKLISIEYWKTKPRQVRLRVGLRVRVDFNRILKVMCIIAKPRSPSSFSVVDFNRILKVNTASQHTEATAVAKLISIEYWKRGLGEPNKPADNERYGWFQ